MTTSQHTAIILMQQSAITISHAITFSPEAASKCHRRADSNASIVTFGQRCGQLFRQDGFTQKIMLETF